MNKLTQALKATVAVTVLVVAPMVAQDPDTRELEQRLRELREEIRQIERQIGRDRFERVGNAFAFRTDGPRVVGLLRNRAQLGVMVQTRADRATDEIGAVLESVTPGSPADEAGLMAGDIIVSFNGTPLTGANPEAGAEESGPAIRLIDLVGEMDEGDEVEIAYRRDGRELTTTATLRQVEGTANWVFSGGDGTRTFDVRVGTDPENLAFPRMEFGDPKVFVTAFLSGVWSDIELVSLNEELGQHFGTDEGLLVIQAPENVDLRGGDVILRIDGREPHTPSRALRILRSYEAGEQMTLEIMRNRRQMTIEVTVPEGLHRRQEMRERRQRR